MHCKSVEKFKDIEAKKKKDSEKEKKQVLYINKESE